MQQPERAIMVVTPCDGDMANEAEVQFVNIEEDISGRDVLTFICPKCGSEHRSYRLG